MTLAEQLQKSQPGKIRVLIVDDSASVRMAMSDIVSGAPDMAVMAVASDPYVAAEKIRREMPDVIILDIEMPRMDGLTFLRKIMSQRPIPVVVCSTLTEQGSELMMEAFEAGAVEVVAKPRVDTAHQLQESRETIREAIRAAAHARVRGVRKPAPEKTVEAKLTADAVIPPLTASRAAMLRNSIPQTPQIICIGASTGGTEALKEVLEALPATAPAIAIVQHMPEKFTAAFARRLNASCAIEVKEAAHGDAMRPGRALIAPGGRHMKLRRIGRSYQVDILDGPAVARHRPSIDVLFRSAAQGAGANAIGVIMTGMGDDGARGLKEMRDMGAFTIGQDEASCIVYGMPKEAKDRGAVAKVAPLKKIASELQRQARSDAETEAGR